MAIKNIIYKDRNFPISYDINNLKAEKSIIFLHGWGSNREIMKQAFKDSFKDFKNIYIDMPGFGKSLNSEILTTDDYKEILKLFFEELKITPYIIIGHSFGGKVATLLNPPYLILLSSAGVIEKKSFLVKFKIGVFKILKFFGGYKFYKFFASNDAKEMPQNMYETFKNVVDEDFTPFFKNFKNRAFIFWGEEDKATSLESGKKIHNLIDNSLFFSYRGDHYFFLKFGKEIEKEILKLI